MKKFIYALGLVTALLTGACTVSQATVLTFDTFPLVEDFPSIDYGGLTFTRSVFGGSASVRSGADLVNSHSNGTNNLVFADLESGALLEITATNGGTFDLISMEMVISWYDFSPTRFIAVTGDGGDPSYKTLFPVLTTIPFDLFGVTNVTITGFGPSSIPDVRTGYWLADNINVNVSAVPLPATLPLLLAGIGGLFGVAKLRSRKNQSA